MRGAVIALLAIGLVCDVSGQEQTGTVRVEVLTSTSEPVAHAEVIIAGVTYQTDESGLAVLDVPAGGVQVTVVREEFLPITVPIDVVAGREQRVSVELTGRTDRRRRGDGRGQHAYGASY